MLGWCVSTCRNVCWGGVLPRVRMCVVVVCCHVSECVLGSCVATCRNVCCGGVLPRVGVCVATCRSVCCGGVLPRVEWPVECQAFVSQLQFQKNISLIKSTVWCFTSPLMTTHPTGHIIFYSFKNTSSSFKTVIKYIQLSV